MFYSFISLFKIKFSIFALEIVEAIFQQLCYPEKRSKPIDLQFECQ